MKGKIVKGIANKATKKAVKSTSKIAGYRKKAQAIIDRGLKRGLQDEMIEVLGTLDVNDLVKSAIGLDKLKHKMKYVRQLPKIKQELEVYKEKVEHKKALQEAVRIMKEQFNEAKQKTSTEAVRKLINDSEYKNIAILKDFDDKKYTSKDLKRFIKEMEDTRLVEMVEIRVEGEIDEFFEKYFKELRLNAKDKPKIEELKNFFRNKMSEFYDFVDYVTTNESFTKRFYDKEDIQGYEEEMRDRLHRMINLTKTKKYK